LRSASTTFRTASRTNHARCPYRNLPETLVIKSRLLQSPLRTASTTARPLFESKSKNSWIFGALIAVGVASTAYGIYDFYNTLTMWPQEVRKDLRAGIKAKNQRDSVLSERYLTRALDTAQKLPLEQFAPEPHLKLSGIAIALATVLEDNQKPQAAYNTYVTAFEQLQSAGDRTGPEKSRAGAIAYKLGQLAESLKSVREERLWYEVACKELLAAIGVTKTRDTNEHVDLAGLSLPAWVNKVQIVEPLRALASCYKRSGDHQLALTTLLVALPIILGPVPQEAPSEHICLGADLLNSIAETLVDGPPTPEAVDQAERSVSQAVELIELRRKRTDAVNGERDYCEMVLAAALFNWGALREMAGDFVRAKQLYQRSRKQSFDLKERDGVIQAETAIRRIDRQNSKPDDDNTQAVERSL